MIIEIKDLPNGRYVKKITFDIEFEDGIPSKEYIEVDTTGQEQGSPHVPEDNSAPVIIPEERPHKPIPDEMRDAQY
jgi:hypothetical protein